MIAKSFDEYTKGCIYGRLYCEGKDCSCWRTYKIEFMENIDINESGWQYDYDFLYSIAIKVAEQANENVSMEQVDAILQAVNYAKVAINLKDKKVHDWWDKFLSHIEQDPHPTATALHWISVNVLSPLEQIDELIQQNQQLQERVDKFIEIANDNVKHITQLQTRNVGLQKQITVLQAEKEKLMSDYMEVQTDLQNKIFQLEAQLKGVETLIAGLKNIIKTGRDWDWGDNFWAVKEAIETLDNYYIYYPSGKYHDDEPVLMEKHLNQDIDRKKVMEVLIKHFKKVHTNEVLQMIADEIIEKNIVSK